MDKLDGYLKLYYDVFGEYFNTFYFVSTKPEEIIKKIKNCVDNKKTMEEMGYIPNFMIKNKDGISTPIYN